MLRRTRVSIGIVICIAIVGGIVFLTKNHFDAAESFENLFSNDEAFYAEMATTSVQTFPLTASSTLKVDLPILVYHIVRPAYPNDSRAVRAIALTPETFDAEMKYLAEAGYHIVSFSDLEDHFRNGRVLPQKPVILSFDDGWSDQFMYAFPILEKYHYQATFFVFTNSIGRRGFLTWNELRRMLVAGMTIGSHTRSHPYLTKIANSVALWDEIRGSKRTLEKRLGVTVNEFAYPFGQYNAAIAAMAAKAGYRSARGDYVSGEQAADRLYALSALNAPTTTILFEKKFP